MCRNHRSHQERIFFHSSSNCAPYCTTVYSKQIHFLTCIKRIHCAQCFKLRILQIFIDAYLNIQGIVLKVHGTGDIVVNPGRVKHASPFEHPQVGGRDLVHWHPQVLGSVHKHIREPDKLNRVPTMKLHAEQETFYFLHLTYCTVNYLLKSKYLGFLVVPLG